MAGTFEVEYPSPGSTHLYPPRSFLHSCQSLHTSRVPHWVAADDAVDVDVVAGAVVGAAVDADVAVAAGDEGGAHHDVVVRDVGNAARGGYHRRRTDRTTCLGVHQRGYWRGCWREHLMLGGRHERMKCAQTPMGRSPIIK